MSRLRILSVAIGILLLPMVSWASSPLYELSAPDIDGKRVFFSQFKGKVLLIVNTASKCGFTSQYEGLQNLYDRYKARGLVILGFPSDDFRQELNRDEDVKYFCVSKYKVNFPLFSKSKIKGDQINPIFKFLTEAAPEDFKGEVRWNFEKFLVSKSGKVVDRFRSRESPSSEELVNKIETLLKENG